METKAQLEAKIASLTADIDGIFAKADTEKRAVSKEELDAIDGKNASIDAAKAEIALQDRAEQTRLAHQNRPKPQRKTTADDPGKKITGQHENFEDDPKKGFKDHREFLLGVQSAAVRKGTDDARLRFLTAGSDEQSTFSDPYGGFFVPVGIMAGFMATTPETDPIGSRTMKVPMTTPQLKINARVDKNHTTSVSGGLRVYRRQEADTVASSRAQFEQVELNAHEQTGVAFATEQLLERSPVSFIAILEAGFRDEFVSELVDERLNGTGTGEYEGILNTACVLSVAKESGQAAATIVLDNIIKMRARAWRYSNCIWMANNDTLPQLMKLNFTVGTSGVPYWLPSAREGEPDILLGRPIIFTEYCKTLGTTGDLWLANWSQYLEGTLSSQRSAESMHVRFLEGERTFKFWQENDGKVWWRSPLTPRNGATLSPFVKLDTRA